MAMEKTLILTKLKKTEGICVSFARTDSLTKIESFAL